MNPLFYQACNRVDSTTGFRYNIHTKSTNKVTVHYHDYYELCFLPQDSCEHLANNEVVRLPRGSLIFIRPEDQHDFINPKLKTVTIIHIAILKNIIDDLFVFLDGVFPAQKLLSNKQPPYVVLNSFEIQKITNLLNNLNRIPPEKVQKKALHMRSILLDIFTSYFTEKKLSTPSTNDNVPPWLLKTCEQMQKVDNFSLGIDRMVELSGVTKEWLCHSLKKYYNCTPSEFINNIRLTYVANMLIYSDIKIVDLCYSSGFSTMSWFHSQFDQKFGCSPGQFRKEHRFVPNDNPN